MDLPRVAPTEVEAIDFQKLYREEKRKARERRRKAKQHQDNNADEQRKSRGGADDDDAQEETNKKEDTTAASPIMTTNHFPPWKYHAKQLTVPPLDRSKDCISSRKKKKHAPSSIYYKSCYLQDADDYQQELLNWLQQLPENKQINSENAANGKWTWLPHAQRRVALFDGEPFPPPLQILVDALVQQSNVFDDSRRPNHILINEYTSTQAGILPHTDGPAYLDRTATISLGGSSSVLLHFTPILGESDDEQQQNASTHNTKKNNKRCCSVLLEGNGSLVVFEGDAYTHYMHSIKQDSMEHADDNTLNAEPGTAVLRSDYYRISITVRHKK